MCLRNPWFVITAICNWDINVFKARLGSETESVLQILSELIQVVADIANTAKDHTHEYTDNGSPLKTKKPEQSGDFGGEKGGGG